MKTTATLMLLTAAHSAHGAAPPTEAARVPHAAVFDPLASNELFSASNDQLTGPVRFDFYVLAQSWQPEFCAGKEKQYPGCVTPQPFWRTHLTMHGLWPELSHGKHPGFCGGAPFDAACLDKAIGRDVLVEYWPDVKFDASSPQYADFWKHEWTRHGTCSGLDEVAYFSAAVNLIRNGTATTPDLVQQNLNKSVSVDALRSAYGGSEEAAVLKCLHGDVFSQVFTCWEKDEKNMPTKRRACPEHTLEEDTCTESTIFIPAFPN